ncbi:hypothetical protein DAMA08_011820 [Martiniozyma asiatica (nom. inval.)]|nr:hypothetical protein DAMA08_011820 [Martiniozyma asiatica]
MEPLTDLSCAICQICDPPANIICHCGYSVHYGCITWKFEEKNDHFWHNWRLQPRCERYRPGRIMGSAWIRVEITNYKTITWFTKVNFNQKIITSYCPNCGAILKARNVSNWVHLIRNPLINSKRWMRNLFKFVIDSWIILPAIGILQTVTKYTAFFYLGDNYFKSGNWLMLNGVWTTYIYTNSMPTGVIMKLLTLISMISFDGYFSSEFILEIKQFLYLSICSQLVSRFTINLFAYGKLLETSPLLLLGNISIEDAEQIQNFIDEEPIDEPSNNPSTWTKVKRTCRKLWACSMTDYIYIFSPINNIHRAIIGIFGNLFALLFNKIYPYSDGSVGIFLSPKETYILGKIWQLYKIQVFFTVVEWLFSLQQMKNISKFEPVKDAHEMEYYEIWLLKMKQIGDSLIVSIFGR